MWTQHLRRVCSSEPSICFQAGYEQLITRMHGQIPKMTSDGTRLQMIVCSATLHDFDVKRLAERLMHFPAWVDLKGQDTVRERKYIYNI